MAQNKWEADKMLDVYIYDYLMKKKLNNTAKTFQAEGKVSTDPVAIDAPGGFLFEWWSVFWDIFITRTNEKHSEAAASYIDVGDLLIRQNPATANSLAAKMYEDKLKLPVQRDSMDESAVKQQRLVENMGQLLDPNNAAVLKSIGVGAPSSGHHLHGAPRGHPGNIQQVQNWNQNLPEVNQEIKGDMMIPRTPGPEGMLHGVHGSNQGNSNLTLKGWPLTGLDQIRLQHQKSLMAPSPQPFNQIQLQQLIHAQQNLGPPSASELDYRKLRMFLGNRNVSSAVDSIGSTMPAGSSLMSRGDADMLMKLQQQQLHNNNLLQQNYQQHLISSPRSQNSNHNLQQHDKMTRAVPTGSVTGDGGVSNFQGNDQASKSKTGRKRKQPHSSSGPTNSSGTVNTTGPSPSSPSSHSTHTQGDVMSKALQHNGGSSKSLLMFGSDGLGSLTSASNKMGDTDRFVDDGSLDDNIDSFLSHEAADPRNRVGQCADISKGFTFTEFRAIQASSSKIECCHFSSDGKLLATGGHDKKAVLWCTESFNVKSTLEEHSQWITDVRFSLNVSRIATSSADKTVRIWDVDNPGYSLRNFMGHSTNVMSVDFHPTKEDLICSCDNNSEIRYWSIKNGSCAGVTKGGSTQVRFQPRLGRILAAAAENVVSLLDVETQGHKSNIHSMCWDPSGDFLATASDDLVRVWAVGPGGKGEFVHELSCSGNKFRSCVFHPTCPSILVVGCYETIELWNMVENKTMTLNGHSKLVSALSASSTTGVVASASHDTCVKLWK
ncbi:hypothetical protein ACFE04_017547 [Oxalis oulophora]